MCCHATDDFQLDTLCEAGDWVWTAASSCACRNRLRCFCLWENSPRLYHFFCFVIDEAADLTTAGVAMRPQVAATPQCDPKFTRSNADVLPGVTGVTMRLNSPLRLFW
ncbi:hypothetical protein TraAM80_03760 [Trypanosoma rangeli]|uniref:Uncharacterized protein n=1 Tax=Trypanosoma rangeli TaxID=5698 RepID=A0A3R7KHS0_TRYRA|nr:uncharacterized protein TraAM80_03760 [Trypanosoma rangeli]RNF06737.1 hypothetical protein TraAM80_03760 [Trypanosoma rangeli]|eukprot:RNF06737.1 hypothetical protein TraAM80_03760 [Trypanosoma rangeli]